MRQVGGCEVGYREWKDADGKVPGLSVGGAGGNSNSVERYQKKLGDRQVYLY